MAIELRDYQINAVGKMKNGCILNGGVGSGKSRTALAYYYILQGCDLNKPGRPSVNGYLKDLYIITTAKKRDSLEWEGELVPFLMDEYDVTITIDSWQNIKKYQKAVGAFFIFDEDRLTGNGAWVKAFYQIAKKNSWIILSATPGDSWSDYIPVFIANGFYRNKTEFITRHIVYSRYSKFPKVDRYLNIGYLNKLRSDILVDMNFERDTIQHHVDVNVEYDILAYKDLFKNRWNYDKNQPIVNASELCYELRKVVNSDPSRIEAVIDICREKQRAIIFYSYDYELDILRSADYGKGFKIAEWNGHYHQAIPDSKKWVYLVNYSSGAEGWNCIKTDCMIFYSQSYSYKTMVQSAGRIDRMNTPYRDLYFYHLKSKSGIDLAIARALKQKKKFNERDFIDI